MTGIFEDQIMYISDLASYISINECILKFNWKPIEEKNN